MAVGRISRALALAAPLVVLASSRGAAAPLTSAWCEPGNLLAGRRPSAWQDLRGNPALVTDGAVAPEGAEWNGPAAVVLETGAGSVTFDLGRPTNLAAIFVQADANDTYKLLGSPDGTPGSYKLLADVDDVLSRGHGLRSRSIRIASEPVRFLRVGEGEGDGLYSIAEIAAYCQDPVPFPPVMRKVDAPLAVVAPRPWYKLDWWDDQASARFEMALALVALALLGWSYHAERSAAARRAAGAAAAPAATIASAVRGWLLAMVGILSFGAYWNFGAFHFWNYTHYHEAYHYYVGSKYFAELSYDRLYECAAVADAEDPALRRRVELRKITNLRTNLLESTAAILAHPERCKEHFTPERWAAFKNDIAFFRARNGVRRWEDAQTDHGYNATPVWNVLGSALASTGPASDEQIWYLTRIDPLFVAGMAAAIWWAFGWRVLCVALAVFATNFPSRFFWTGGAYLRWDWLFHMTVGVCFIKKKRPVVGGYLVGYAALLRVFPGFLFVGPLLVVLRQLFDRSPRSLRGARSVRPRRKLDRGCLAVLLGGALAVGTLVPISLAASGGVGGYRAFIRNSQKHTATALTNNMGWRTVVAYKEAEAGRRLFDNRLEDPWKAWKEARLRTFHRRLWLYLTGVLGFLALLHRAVKGLAAWEATALGALLIAVVPELTSYYYSFLIVLALLWESRRVAGLALLAATAATGFIAWAPIAGMPTWLDEQHTLMSAATLLGIACILYDLCKQPEKQRPEAKVLT
jgi:hypothetical protein